MKESVAVSQYILNAAPFARPILEHIRALVHSACPESTEAMKWSFPNFMYKDKILCHMAAFSKHCAFGFWLGSIMEDPENILKTSDHREGMGNLGKITKPGDLPSNKIMKAYILQAKSLIDQGKTLPKKKPAATKEIIIPADLKTAFKENEAAKLAFTAMSPSHKNEYISWITEAKREETRIRRIEVTLQNLEEGKSRNWKYEAKMKKA